MFILGTEDEREEGIVITKNERKRMAVVAFDEAVDLILDDPNGGVMLDEDDTCAVYEAGRVLDRCQSIEADSAVVLSAIIHGLTNWK